MRHWQDVLGHIRLLGPDIPVFREDVKFINDHIVKLEEKLFALQTSDSVPNLINSLRLRVESLERALAEAQPQPVAIDENWPGYEC